MGIIGNKKQKIDAWSLMQEQLYSLYNQGTIDNGVVQPMSTCIDPSGINGSVVYLIE